MSSFLNTTDASIHRPMCKQPLNLTPVISWPVRRHFKATKFKLVTKIPYRTLVNSNWSCLWWRLDSKVWGVIVVNKRLCILTQWATKTHDGTVFGISWRQTGTLVLLSKTKGLTIKISKYCAGCFSMNINHLIFVHHIVLSISQYPYVDSYIWPSFIEIWGRD